VGRGDGGGVEVGKRSGEALAPLGDLIPRALRQQRDDPVLWGRARQRAVESLLGADEALADALPELAGGHAREGHEQELLERRAFGDVAGRERGMVNVFPVPALGLEDGDPGRQRAADVERLDVGGHALIARHLLGAAARPTAAARSAEARGSPRPSPRRLVGAGGSASTAASGAPPRPARARARGPPPGTVRDSHAPARAPPASPPRARRPRRPPRTARERQRLAHAAVVEVDERGEVRARRRRRARGQRRDPGDGHARVSARPPCRPT
jgi:hypothetical protein